MVWSSTNGLAGQALETLQCRVVIPSFRRLADISSLMSKRSLIFILKLQLNISLRNVWLYASHWISLSLNFFPKKRLDNVYILLYTSLHYLIEMVTELPTSSFNNLKFYRFVPWSTESPPSSPFAVYIHSLLRRHESTVVNGVNSGIRQAWAYILALPVPSCMATENHLNSMLQFSHL